MSLREVWENVKAWKRGETRMTRKNTRGRVYRRSEVSSDGGKVMVANSQMLATINPSRVYSAKEGKWFTYEEWQKRNK